MALVDPCEGVSTSRLRTVVLGHLLSLFKLVVKTHSHETELTKITKISKRQKGYKGEHFPETDFNSHVCFSPVRSLFNTCGSQPIIWADISQESKGGLILLPHT
jgi:hypothetical protein